MSDGGKLMFDEEEKIKDMISMAWALGNDDVDIMLDTISSEFEALGEEYLLNQKEAEEIACSHCNETLRLDNHSDEV